MHPEDISDGRNPTHLLVDCMVDYLVMLMHSISGCLDTWTVVAPNVGVVLMFN